MSHLLICGRFAFVYWAVVNFDVSSVIAGGAFGQALAVAEWGLFVFFAVVVHSFDVHI